MDWRVNPANVIKSVKRVRLAFVVLMVVMAVFLVRLFYVQVISYNHFHNVAMTDQLKQYEIPAQRGIIEAQQGNSVVPIVLNQMLYTLYADPAYIKNPDKVADSIAKVLGGSASDYASELKTPGSRYVVLKKRVSTQQKDQMLAYEYPGIGAQGQDYRTYPNGDMAAQLLGFVDDNGQGQYGVEQALNKDLSGTPGRVKAVTDINGVPLAANSNNISVQPKAGDNVVLTIDTAMQKSLEQILKQGDISGQANGASALILDANTGAVKAMANYPSYNPAEYYDVSNSDLFQNGTVSHAIEPGSIMKTLTTAAALNQGVITPSTTFYDPGHWTVDGFNITDVEDSTGPQSMETFLNLSLNTGATWLLMQMGGGQINKQARDNWYGYMTQHFRLGKKTGITQGYEDAGYVPSPDQNGAGINLTYANTSFGQAVTATPLQMAAAEASALNGGTYYQPRLVSQITSPDGKTQNFGPKVLETNVVKPSTSQGLASLMQYVMENRAYLARPFDQTKYTVGGKTGTAQIAKPGGGGYYDNKYNASFIGFVGGTKPQYIIVVFAYDPNTSEYSATAGFAGELVAQPIFVGLAHMLIDNGYVAPKT